MPTIPPQISTPYDTVTGVLNMARTRLNDRLATLVPVSGKVLDNNEPFTQQVFNTAYRTMQARISDLGTNRLNKEFILTGCPICSNTDPSAQTYVDWFEYYDGNNYFQQPVLPSDLIFPLWISERQTGMNACFPYTPNMENMVGGIPGYQKWIGNRFWQWREDKIFMPGSLYSMDLRIGYAAYLPDFVDVVDQRWFQQNVPIMRCLGPLSWYVCFEFCIARSAASPTDTAILMSAANSFKGMAESETDQLFRRDVQQNANVNVRRLPRNGGGSGRWGYGSIC